MMDTPQGNNQVTLLVQEDSAPVSRAHESDAGLDIHAPEHIVWDMDQPMKVVDTGMRIAIPEGYMGLIVLRSSVAQRGIALANSVGVIDSGYRGTIKLQLVRMKETHPPVIGIGVGARLAQLLIVPIPQVTIEYVLMLPESERGEAGLGSTGQ